MVDSIVGAQSEVGGGGGAVNVAVTVTFEFMVTVQLPVPEHAPDHPLNVEPLLGIAVRVTTVPAMYVGPVGLAVAVPVPVPAFKIVNVNCTGGGKGAATKILAVLLCFPPMLSRTLTLVPV